MLVGSGLSSQLMIAKNVAGISSQGHIDRIA